MTLNPYVDYSCDLEPDDDHFYQSPPLVCEEVLDAAIYIYLFIINVAIYFNKHDFTVKCLETPYFDPFISKLFLHY